MDKQEGLTDQELEAYAKARESASNFYKKVGKVMCPAFQDTVVFNAEGFNHLSYSSKNKERDKSVQKMRFALLPDAKKLLSITTIYQEYDEQLIEVKKKRHKKTYLENEMAKYWAFVGVLQNKRIKVIVRQVGNGNKHFWSVIPAWKKSKYGRLKINSNCVDDLAEE